MGQWGGCHKRQEKRRDLLFHRRASADPVGAHAWKVGSCLRDPVEERPYHHVLVQWSTRVTNCILILLPSTVCMSSSVCPASMPYSSGPRVPIFFVNQGLPILSPCGSSETDHTSLLQQCTLTGIESRIGM